MSKKKLNRQKQIIRKKQPQKKTTNWIPIIGVVLGIGLLGIGIWFARPSTNSPAQATAEAAVIEDGKAIYESTCATCHGNEGQGHVQFNAPALTGAEHAWHHSDAQIINIIRTGGEKMPPVGAEFDNKKVKLILTYIKQWWTPQQRTSQQGTIGE